VHIPLLQEDAQPVYAVASLVDLRPGKSESGSEITAWMLAGCASDDAKKVSRMCPHA
jgi:undecaprenyl pyrophosphate phosphatase UppP